MNKLQNLNNWAVFYILVGVTGGSLLFSFVAHAVDGQASWWSWVDGAFQNFSTEMMGAIMTFALFELVVGKRNEKNSLIIQMRSKDNPTARNAVAQLGEHGWLSDGSLAGANLRQANLEGANLWEVNMSGADLWGANLKNTRLLKINFSGAKLHSTNLEGAQLRSSNLQGADLIDANLLNADLTDVNLEGAYLPDGTIWTFASDIRRFTDSEHPNFWQPEWVQNDT